MNEIIQAVTDLDVDKLLETSPETAIYTVEAIEIALEDQVRDLAAYREQVRSQRAEVERKLNEVTFH
jgi:parvulin-like peptidyl-prolyl isomerase